MLKSVIKRALWPGHLFQAVKASKKGCRVSRSVDDPQLELYDKILQTDFLHYGYFEDPEFPADRISLHDIRRAQLKYAELIIDQIHHPKGAVLDVGCGMGGLIGLLLDKGFSTVGVTPDRRQIKYVQGKYPKARLIQAKFQSMPMEGHESCFDTVIHSESLQYIKLDQAFDKVQSLLKPGGRWIVVDYFRFGETHAKSGHPWKAFEQLVESHPFKIIHQQDITSNIMPTLAYIHMWGNQIGKPVFEFAVGKLRKKHPGKYYILEELIEQINGVIDKNLDIVNPSIFVEGKKYIFMTLERY